MSTTGGRLQLLPWDGSLVPQISHRSIQQCLDGPLSSSVSGGILGDGTNPAAALELPVRLLGGERVLVSWKQTAGADLSW